MADRDEADAERPDPDDVACLDLVHARLEGGLILLELVPDQPQRQTRPVERDVEARQHEGQGPRMVLVAVGDDDRQHLLTVRLQVGDVGDDVVDPRQLLVREHQAAVDHDDIVAVLDGVHVLADLPQAAQGDELQRCVPLSARGGSPASAPRPCSFFSH